MPEPAAWTFKLTFAPAFVTTLLTPLTRYGSLSVKVAAELEALEELLSVTVTEYPGEFAASVETRLSIVSVVAVVALALAGLTCARPPKSPSLLLAPSFFHWYVKGGAVPLIFAVNVTESLKFFIVLVGLDTKTGSFTVMFTALLL